MKLKTLIRLLFRQVRNCIYVYVCVCVYIFIHTYIYTHAYIHTHTLAGFVECLVYVPEKHHTEVGQNPHLK